MPADSTPPAPKRPRAPSRRPAAAREMPSPLPVPLVCPETGAPLKWAADGTSVFTDAGRHYPVVEGIPVLLRGDTQATHRSIRRSLRMAESARPGPQSERQGDGAAGGGIDDTVRKSVGAVAGMLYLNNMEHMARYPVPEIPLPPGDGKVLLDIGANWGRWSHAASRKGYTVVAIDPNLESMLAGLKVDAHFGVKIHRIVGDARYLPFPDLTFDTVFSNGVLQHFAKDDVRRTLDEVGRVLKDDGLSKIQMANILGLNNTITRARRLFRAPIEFEARYWMPSELVETFRNHIGPTSLEPDCFFSLNAQAADLDLMEPHARAVVQASELLKKVAAHARPLGLFADSVYLTSNVTWT